MSTEDREVSWAEAAEISKRTLLDAEARRDALADREAAAATDINLLDELDIGDEDTDFGRGYARAQRDLADAGWLPPDEAERLRATNFAKVRRLEEMLTEMRAARDNLLRNAEVLADEVVHAHAERAAVQPVIDAARRLVRTIRNGGGALLVRRHADIVAALDALDGGSPEGLKQ